MMFQFDVGWYSCSYLISVYQELKGLCKMLSFSDSIFPDYSSTGHPHCAWHTAKFALGAHYALDCVKTHISHVPQRRHCWVSEMKAGSGMSHASSSHFLDPVWPEGVSHSSVERNSLPCPALPTHPARQRSRHHWQECVYKQLRWKGHTCLREGLQNPFPL